MADEPPPPSSRPMDQDDDNDEFFSARETQRRQGDALRSDRESSATPKGAPDASPNPSSRQSRKSTRQQHFFSDEKAVQGSDKAGSSSKRRKDKNKWDRRDYKKEELDPSPKPPAKPPKKKAKAKTPNRLQTEEASKTDEETDQKSAPEARALTLPTPQPARPPFQLSQYILGSNTEKATAPRCSYSTLRFEKRQEIVEFDCLGEQPQLAKFNERAITNNWRRWGAHRALCDQGGYLIDPSKRMIKIEKGSAPPPCPPDRCQVTLNKNAELADSQSLFGSIRVQPGPAVAEALRIGKLVEKMVEKGGFVPKKMDFAAGGGGQPLVVVVKTNNKQAPKPAAVAKVKQKKGKESKKKKKGKNGSSSTDSDSVSDDGSEGSGVDKKKAAAKEQPEVAKEDSNKGRGGVFRFFRRKKPPPPPPPPQKPSPSKEVRRKKNKKD